MFGRRRGGVGVLERSGVALVTRDGGGVSVLEVFERGGVLCDLSTGEPVDLLSLVVVSGLPEL